MGETADSDDGDILSALIDTFQSDEEDVEEKPPKSLTTESSSLNKAQADKPKPRQLEEVDIFSGTSNPTSKHNNDSLSQELFGDDSDDETAMGSSRIAKSSSQTVVSSGFYDNQSTSSASSRWIDRSRTAHISNNENQVKDPLLGLYLINPKVSMEFLRKAAFGKEIVMLSKADVIAKRFEKEKKDWITMAVISSKTETKKSTKSNTEYIIFRLVDMSNVDCEISLFLFGSSYHKHWKTAVGSAIGLMNPVFMKSDSGQRRESLTLRIFDASQLLVVGTSKDFGTCKSMTKNGNVCTNVVNKSKCDTCRFHTMKAHKASMQQRSELNSAHGSREPDSSRQRILGKLSTTRSRDDCITYGGQSYLTKQSSKTGVSLKSVLNRSQQKGNLSSIMNLHNLRKESQADLLSGDSKAKTKAERHLEELITKPSTASMHFMKHLINKEVKGGSGSGDTPSAITSVKPAELLKMQQKKFDEVKQLKKSKSDVVLLETSNKSINPTSMSAKEYKQLLLKKKAAAVIQAQGGIRKEDVNSTRKSLSSRQKESLKQRLNDSVGDSADDTGPETVEPDAKRSRLDDVDVNAEKYRAIRNQKSINSHLVKQVQSEREDQYFDVLEKKEMYENKLLDTHMIEATLFYCPICDYEDWRLSDICRKEGHKYKKLPALKRFFQCTKCKDRIATHEKFPTTCCRKCGGRNFSKAGMIAERKVTLANEELSLRGNEETKMGCFDSKVNVDIS